jgi:hypothetical protein
VTAPRLTTPLVWAPVTARPSFTGEELAAHREAASGVWADAWDLAAQAKRLRALDVDRDTLGHRYLGAVTDAPWLSLALERAGVARWQERLFLLEAWTRPSVQWFSTDQSDLLPPVPYADIAPPQPAPRSLDRAGRVVEWEPTEQILTTGRHVYLAILLDLGAAEIDPVRMKFGTRLPDDEERRPSRLIAAGLLAGLGRKGNISTKVVARAADRGRGVLRAVGAWPWAHFDGALPPDWWTTPDAVGPFADWVRTAEADESARRAQRRAAQGRAGVR